MKTPICIAVTGAAGQIGYSLLSRTAAGGEGAEAGFGVEFGDADGGQFLH